MKEGRGAPSGRGPPWPRPEAHLPAGMTEGGGTVKQSQWHYEHSDIFLLLPRGPGVANLMVVLFSQQKLINRYL